MTEIHAIQNGNWSDASTWDLNRVPDVDDIVYVDAYNITIAGSVTVKTIIFNSIGTLTGNNKTINANIECNGNPATYYISGTTTMTGNIVEDSTNHNAMIFYNATTLTGNVKMYGCALCRPSGNSSTWTFNSNIEIFNLGAFNIICDSYVGRIDVNGKIYIDETSERNGVIVDAISPNGTQFGRYFYEIESYSHFQPFSGRIGNDWDASRWIVNKITLHNAPYIFNGTILNITFGDIDIKQGTIGNFSYKWVFAGNVKQNSTGLNVGNTQVTSIAGKSSNYNDAVSVVMMTKEDYNSIAPQESDVKEGVHYGINRTGTYAVDYPQEANVLKDVEYDNGNKVGTLEVIALSGATATADNISVVNLTEQEVNRVKNCATVSTVQKCFADFKEE